MIIRNHAQTIQKITEKMNGKEKFAYVNFPRSAIMAMSDAVSNEKKPSKYFTRSILNSFNISHPNFIKSIPPSFIYSGEEDNVEKFSNILKDSEYYDSTTLEYYFSSNEDIFKSFVNHYIRHSSFVVVSFHDRKIINKILGTPVDVINVAYNDFYDKTDSIIKSIAQYEGKADYCIFDCPLLSSALPYKMWNEIDMSILDLGKVFSIARTNYLNKMRERESEKKEGFKSNKRF